MTSELDIPDTNVRLWAGGMHVATGEPESIAPKENGSVHVSVDAESDLARALFSEAQLPWEERRELTLSVDTEGKRFLGSLRRWQVSKTDDGRYSLEIRMNPLARDISDSIYPYRRYVEQLGKSEGESDRG